MKSIFWLGILLAAFSFKAEALTDIPKIIYSPNCMIGIDTQAPTDEEGNSEMVEKAIQIINNSGKGYSAYPQSQCLHYRGESDPYRKNCDLKAYFSTTSADWTPTLNFYLMQNFDTFYNVEKRGGLGAWVGSGRKWFLSNIKNLPKCHIRN